MSRHTVVVRADGLGDVVLAGPAVRAAAATGSRITMLCSARGEPAATEEVSAPSSPVPVTMTVPTESASAGTSRVQRSVDHVRAGTEAPGCTTT